MTAFRNTIERTQARAKNGFPGLPTTLPAIEKAVRELTPVLGEPEAIEDLLVFLARCSQSGIGAIRRRDLNRVLRGAWFDEQFDTLGVRALEQSESNPRRSTDQAIIAGYIVYFPAGRPIMPILASAANHAAKRHHWAWRKRAEEWAMFDPNKGPELLGKNLLATGQSVRQSQQINTEIAKWGLGTNLAASRFGRAAFRAACRLTAGLAPEDAERPQARLISLYDDGSLASDVADLACALLQPWLEEKPQTEHRKKISALLIEQVGDPRINNRWNDIEKQLASEIGSETARAITNVFKRWLTEVAMREFFRAIAKTTDRPDQWEAREKFWLAYLDAGLVSDAWPALGRRANHRIEQLMKNSDEQLGFGIMKRGPASSSTIIMQIGDLRIAEWSHNGSCRFWHGQPPKAVELYRKFYDGYALGTTKYRQGFHRLNHTRNWQPKFADFIYRNTNIEHPEHGRGEHQYRSW